MSESIFPIFYGAVVLILLWQAFRVMRRVNNSRSMTSENNPFSKRNLNEDRTGRLTIHPELLDQEGRITNEELLTVRFTGDNEPPSSTEASAE